MKFYEELSDFYEGVFPLNKGKINFIEEHMTEGAILDIACGVGSDVLELNKRGHHARGLDLEANMIGRAKELSESQNIQAEFLTGSMLELEEIYGERKFATILCTGNSLVHLPTKEQIRDFIQQAYGQLEEKGALIMQIINFDRILDDKVKALPTIHNEDDQIEFIRDYEHVGDRIMFRTRLTARGKEYTNEIVLLPLRQQELEEMLVEAGFSSREYYGSFKGDAYDHKSYATVVVANK